MRYFEISINKIKLLLYEKIRNISQCGESKVIYKLICSLLKRWIAESRRRLFVQRILALKHFDILTFRQSRSHAIKNNEE